MSDPTNEERLAIARARIQAIREALAALTKAEWSALSEQKALRDGDQTAADVWRDRTTLNVLEHDRALGRP